jgi:hypothetical protein
MEINKQTIIICCPGNVISGGVNSLHNLCRSLRLGGFNAAMYYLTPDEKVLANIQITSYSVERVASLTDDENTLVIVPETMVQLLMGLKKAHKMVYWLGLNYFFKNPTWRFPFNIKLCRKLISCRSYSGYSAGAFENLKRRLNEYAKSHLNIWGDDVVHLTNSYFVANYCQQKGSPNTYVLLNPIRDEFYEVTPSPNRDKLILFGPKTPKRIINKLRRELPAFKIVRLKGLPITEVHQLMSKAMVFAEFGNYSGRDRMPREAAMLGCCVYMNTRGSAAFSEDYDIAAHYKIADTPNNTSIIVDRIKQTVFDYDTHVKQFETFKEQLRKEKIGFARETERVFTAILKNEKI